MSAPQRRGPPLRHRLFESTLPSLICGPRRRPRSRSKPRDPKMSLGDALVEEMAGGAGVVRVIGSGRSFPVGAEHRQTACQQASPPPHPEASCSRAAHTAKRVGEVAATPAGPSPRRRTLRPPYTAVSPTRTRRRSGRRPIEMGKDEEPVIDMARSVIRKPLPPAPKKLKRSVVCTVHLRPPPPHGRALSTPAPTQAPAPVSTSSLCGF